MYLFMISPILKFKILGLPLGLLTGGATHIPEEKVMNSPIFFHLSHLVLNHPNNLQIPNFLIHTHRRYSY